VRLRGGVTGVIADDPAKRAGQPGRRYGLIPCGALPMAAQNLGEVQSGVDEDYLAAQREEN